MYAFHRILADYSPLVEFFILDAKESTGLLDEVRLTVLVHPFTSQTLMERLYLDLKGCMPFDQVVEIAADFDLKSGEDALVLWRPTVMRSAMPL